MAKSKTYEPAEMVKKIEAYIDDACRWKIERDEDGEIVGRVYGFPIKNEVYKWTGGGKFPKWTKSHVEDLATREEYKEVADALRGLLDAKETRLERGGAYGWLNKTYMVIALKQLGWEDANSTKGPIKIELGSAGDYAE